ncbi:hypothetical protein DYB37_007425 [Aphanomyces astaci]|uniref:Uncharacterized protein n=1 Tax=Aphanomyces astaci TaxID=112090 RepID=A0A3R7A4G8_APHAT|nr:hypothetical protein DYB35_007138 [Aphanomyces astaci]RHZ20829.1 hypothetical protein DYB37_007425 [Aphanomyces astaci]
MGEYDHLGAILEQSSATKVSLYPRGLVLLFVLAGFATSRKTTRWTQGPIIATFWKRMRQTLAPPLHSHTFSFASYCLNNSDWFVVVYVVAVILDKNNSITYSRLVYQWNIEDDRQSTVAVQARAMRMIQWFLMCHTMWFGLPENPKHMRAMLTKSIGMALSGETTRGMSRFSAGNAGDPPALRAHVMLRGSIQGQHKGPTLTTEGDDVAPRKMTLNDVNVNRRHALQHPNRGRLVHTIHTV